MAQHSRSHSQCALSAGRHLNKTAHHLVTECRYTKRVWCLAASWTAQPNLKPEKWQASDSALDWWSKITNTVDIPREAIRSFTLLINMRDMEGKKWESLQASGNWTRNTPRGTTAVEWLPPASSRCSTLQHSSQFHHLIDFCTQISGIFAPPAYIHKTPPWSQGSNPSP